MKCTNCFHKNACNYGKFDCLKDVEKKCENFVNDKAVFAAPDYADNIVSVKVNEAKEANTFVVEALHIHQWKNIYIAHSKEEAEAKKREEKKNG